VSRSSRRTRVAHELEERRSRILDRDAVALAPLVDALRRGDPRARRHPHDAADDGLDDVAPVRVHVEDDASAARAIIPARALAGLRHWLFAIDVLAGRDRLFQRGDAALRRGRVEEDRVGGVRERGVEIDSPIRKLVGARDGGKARGVAAREQQARNQSVIAERKPALGDDWDQGVRQMLGRADAAGRAVDNDADRVARHRAIPLRHPHASPAGLTRGSIILRKNFLRRGWIAGS